MSAPTFRSVDRVAPGVHFIEGPASNWVVLVGDSEVALIDASYPGDLPLVEQSLREAAPGLPLTAIAVTHGHSDHIGSIRALLGTYPDARVYTGEAELPNVRRDEIHQVTVRDIVPHLAKPRFVRWMVHALRAGGLGDVAVRSVEAAPTELALAGHAVRAVPSIGHTPGHTLYELVDARAVATGDALVTGHAVSRRVGPQSLHPMFHSDVRAASQLAAELAGRYADWTLLPGHGALRRRGTSS